MRVLRPGHCVALAILLLGTAPVWSQPSGPLPYNPADETGLPFVRRWGTRDYQVGFEQNWGVAQAEDGLMYVANHAGVMEYDGVSWRLIPTDNQLTARSLAVAADGRVWVGGVGTLGYLASDSVDSLHYRPLTGLIPQEHTQFSDVWKTHALNGKIIFQTPQYLFIFSSTDQAPSVIRAEVSGQGVFHNSFAVGSDLYVRQEGVGLLRLAQDRLEPVTGGQRFALDKIMAMLPAPQALGGGVLVASRAQGLQRLKGNTWEAVPTPANAWLTANQVYCGRVLPDGSLAFGSLRGGALVLWPTGTVRYLLAKGQGLYDDTVYDLFVDRQDGLWLAQNNGLARVEVLSPLTRYQEQLGLEGVVNDLKRWQGQLYACTSLGLFRLDARQVPARFERLPVPPTQYWALLPTAEGLWVAGQQGVGLWQAQRLQMFTALPARALYASRHNPGRMYVGLVSGWGVLHRQGAAAWRFAGPLGDVTEEISSLQEESASLIWMGSFSQGALRQRVPDGPVDQWRDVPPADRLGTARGLPNGPVRVYRVLDKIRFQTRYGTHTYSPDQGFRPDQELSQFFGQDTVAVDYVTQVSPTRWWVALTDGMSSRFFAAQVAGQWNLTPAVALRRLAREIEVGNVEHFDTTGTLWLGGFDGAVRYESTQAKTFRQTFRTHIRRVSVGDSLGVTLYGGARRTPDGAPRLTDAQRELPVLEHNHGRLRFEFAAPSLDLPELTLYRYRLEGLEKEWSPWSQSTQVEYTNLPPGNYYFKVQSLNRFGKEGQEANFRLRIRGPWYASPLALLMYGLLLGGIIWGLVRWSTAVLKTEKQLLERRVRERTEELQEQSEAAERATAEVRAQNKTLADAYRLIEIKNNDILDSLNYAKRIQETILPGEAEVRKSLPQFFVYFRPRDIVSGDFYWYARRGNRVLLAAVDCTGHGVPGAFMSVMGYTLLNHVVDDEGIQTPNELLSEMHRELRQMLKTSGDGRQSMSQDGMDMAFISFNLDNNVLQFAGANRPLWVVQRGEMVEISGNKVGLGGKYVEDELEFDLHQLALSPGDSVFMASDGYADQFGGPHKRKFMTRAFSELLMELHPLTTRERRTRLDQVHREWRRELEQLDDIMVIGFKL